MKPCDDYTTVFDDNHYDDNNARLGTIITCRRVLIVSRGYKEMSTAIPAMPPATKDDIKEYSCFSVDGTCSLFLFSSICRWLLLMFGLLICLAMTSNEFPCTCFHSKAWIDLTICSYFMVYTMSFT